MENPAKYALEVIFALARTFCVPVVSDSDETGNIRDRSDIKQT
jgi:hypothetical protein